MTIIEFGGAASLWLYMLWYTWRLLQRSPERPRGRSPMHYIWGLLLAACGVFTLRIVLLQEALDHLVGDTTPLGQGLRSASIILAAWCYLLLLWHIHKTSPQIIPPLIKRLYPYFSYLPPLVLVEIGCLLVLPLLNLLDYTRTYYLIILSVDVVALPLIFCVYIPINIRMVELETVPEMRVKQLATIMLCLLYAFAAVRFFPRNVIAIQNGEMLIHHSKDVIVILAVICIMLQFAPFKLIGMGLLPLKYGRYWRLLRLEQRVAALTAAVSRGTIWIKPAELENARYAAIISILDNTPALPDDTAGKQLRQQIEQILHQHRDYPSLAQALLEQQL